MGRCAAFPRGGNPRPPKKPETPRVVELLRKAIEWKDLLESGKAASQAEIARREGVTRARVTQVLGMLRLAPEIQNRIVTLPKSVRPSSVTERLIRPITAITDYHDQIREFQKLLG